MHDNTPKFEYLRELGWAEFNDDGEMVKATITVSACVYGYVVLRFGHPHVEFLKWFRLSSDAIEWAVDRVRKEQGQHEMAEQSGHINRNLPER